MIHNIYIHITLYTYIYFASAYYSWFLVTSLTPPWCMVIHNCLRLGTWSVTCVCGLRRSNTRQILTPLLCAALCCFVLFCAALWCASATVSCCSGRVMTNILNLIFWISSFESHLLNLIFWISSFESHLALLCAALRCSVLLCAALCCASATVSSWSGEAMANILNLIFWILKATGSREITGKTVVTY